MEAQSEKYETSQDAPGYVKEVKLSQINPPEWDVRYQRQNDGDYAEKLKKDIKEHGLLQPVILRPISDIRYEVVAGTYRVGACQDLGYETIKARIMELDDDEAIAMALRENEFRKEMSTYEKARVVSRLRNIHNKKWKEISEMTGLSKRYCRKLHDVNQHLPDPSYTQWKKGIISFNTAYDRLHKHDGKNPNPKHDFLTGERVYDYETIRVSEDTHGTLKVLKEDMEKITRTHTQADINHIFYEKEENITQVFEENFGKYGTDLASAIHGLLIRKLESEG